MKITKKGIFIGLVLSLAFSGFEVQSRLINQASCKSNWFESSVKHLQKHKGKYAAGLATVAALSAIGYGCFRDAGYVVGDQPREPIVPAVDSQGNVVSRNRAASNPVVPTYEPAGLLRRSNSLDGMLLLECADIGTSSSSSTSSIDDAVMVDSDVPFEGSYRGYQCEPVEFTHRDAHDNQKILFAAVHGTWASNKSYGQSEESAQTRYINDLMQNLSNTHRKNVVLLPFKWSGYKNQSTRQEAGLVLAQHIRHNYRSGDAVMFLSHSYGGDVVLHAARELNSNNIKTDRAILFAGLLTDHGNPGQSRAGKFGIGKLYHFYGTNDCIQVLGQFDATKRTWGRKLQVDGVKLYNVCVRLDGDHTNHKTIKQVIPHLAMLTDSISCCYPHHLDLNANIETGNPEASHLVIRNQDVTYNGGDDGDASIVLQEDDDTVQIERNFSSDQARAFQVKYNCDIGYKGNPLIRPFVAAWDEGRSYAGV